MLVNLSLNSGNVWERSWGNAIYKPLKWITKFVLRPAGMKIHLGTTFGVKYRSLE